jgi:hypothetical protein
MRKTGLEFASGTTEDCQKLIARLFRPAELLGSYQHARRLFNSSDIVLVSDEIDPADLTAWPRRKYIQQLRVNLGQHAKRVLPFLTMNTKSAHQIVRMPLDSDAFWLVIERRFETPIMCVLFANPYEEMASSDPEPAMGEA